MVQKDNHNIAFFRFYEELNDFLPPEKQKISFEYYFSDNPAIKDAIEAIGIPHTEVDLILVNGHSVGFDYHLQKGDRVSVYPVFEALDITTVSKVREKPLRNPRFILDVHLGKLARLLRLLGFDTLYRNDYPDLEIVKIAHDERRIILTRDRGILKFKIVTHGYWIRNTASEKQLYEVMARFQLKSLVTPFQRCLECNGLIVSIEKEKVIDQIPQKAASYYNHFYNCTDCRKIYWQGSHFKKMEKFVQKFIAQNH